LADLAGRAFIIAFATVIAVGLEVDTDAITLGQSGLTRECAISIRADLAGGAFIVTSSAVIAVGLEIYTDVIAIV
jgi:hypothetical protein